MFLVDNSAIFLLLFSIGFNVFFPDNPIFSTYVITSLTAPVLFYLFGKYQVFNIVEYSDILKIIFYFTILYCLYLYISTIWDIYSGAPLLLPARKMIALDGGELSATLIGLVVTIGFTGIGALLFLNKQCFSIIYLCFLLSLVFAFLTTIHLINRTGIVISFMLLIVVFIYKYGFKVSRIIVFIVLTLLFAYIMLHFNLIDEEIIAVYRYRMESAEVTGEGAGGDRIWRWGDALIKIIVYPFGWINNNATYNNYVHNLWLDVARQTGIFPFLFILYPTISSMQNVLNLFFKTHDVISGLLICLFFCFFMASMVEPVMEGFPYSFYCFCWLFGVIKQWNCHKRFFVNNIKIL